MYKIKYNATFASTLMITIKKKDRNNVRFQELTSCTEGSVINPIPVPLKLHHNFSTNTGLFVCLFVWGFFSPTYFAHQVLQEEPGVAASCFLVFVHFFVRFIFLPKSSSGPVGIRRNVGVRQGAHGKVLGSYSFLRIEHDLQHCSL